jgi:2,4-dienoyl-CoA reductase-like NADH-dependent reductase (Old Yellow Enzyme family)
MRAALGEALTVPVIGTGRIASLGVAERVLADGDCGLVGMTRAHIADPDIIAKSVRREAHRVRPCTGANVCVNRKLAATSTGMGCSAPATAVAPNGCEVTVMPW